MNRQQYERVVQHTGQEEEDSNVQYPVSNSSQQLHSHNNTIVVDDDGFIDDIDLTFNDNDQLLSETTSPIEERPAHIVTNVASSTTAPPPQCPPSYDKEAPPPEYVDYTLPPPYISPTSPQHETAAYMFDSQDDELLIDGLPVGHPFLLIVNLMISMSFDFVGFMLTYMLATSHSARAGSRLGFGLTLLRYGLYVRYAEEDQDMYAHRHYNSHMTPAEFKAQTRFMSYLLMILGFLILVFANIDYYRVNKIRRVIMQGATDPSQQV